MINKFRVQIERVENGYIITNTVEGSSFSEYSTQTLIKTNIDDAFTVALKHLEKANIIFSNIDNKESL